MPADVVLSDKTLIETSESIFRKQIYCDSNMGFVSERVKNIAVIGENASFQHLLLFQHYF